MAKRTDIHRPAVIVPADYSHRFSYALPTGPNGDDPFGYNMEELRAFGERTGWGRLATTFGAPGNCGVCGACFRMGDLYQHDGGDYIHVGHECAAKLDMLADDPDFRAHLAAVARNRKARFETARRDANLLAFIAAKGGNAAEVLDLDHATIRDMRDRIRRFGDISPKAWAYACAIFDRVKNPPPPKPEERKVAAPTGRVEIVGVCISAKTSDWGTRLTFKVETADGVWLCNGNAFARYKDTYGGVQVGDRVRFRATLKAGNSPHFVFYKRPLALETAPKPELAATEPAADPFAEFAAPAA